MKNKNNDLICYILGTLAVILIIVSFLLPPMGVVDNSVLTATGLITLIIAIERIKVIDLGKLRKNVKVSKGDFEIEVKDHDSN